MTKSVFSTEYLALRARLVEMRKHAGLTQRALADRLSVPRSFVSRVEAGDRRVDLIEFAWICKACGVAPEKAVVRLFREMRRK